MDIVFIYIPVGEQIKDLLQSGYVAEHMIDVVRNPGSFSDAVDGDMYQRVCGDPCIENLTLTWNYDGLPVFKSSGASLWPILAQINELRPDARSI